MSRNNREEIIHEIIRRALETNDWVIINFTLKKCYNKSRIFERFNEREESFLHIASYRNLVNCLKVLIEHGFNSDYRNITGNTCLHIASSKGYKGILYALIEANANPFICNKKGQQALEIARDQSVKEILRHYTVKCTEIKLIKNLKIWRQIFAEEEKVDLIIDSSKVDKSVSLQDLPKTVLKRTDSGIVADAESTGEKSLKLNLTSHSFDETSKSTTRSPSNEKTKFAAISGAILGATLSPTFASSKELPKKVNETSKFRKLKSLSVRDFSKHAGIIRSLSNKSISEQDENNKVGGLKVTSQYENSKRTSAVTKKRRKFNRNERMSMPEMSILSTAESYI